jgi:hypothetical protein
MKPRAELDAVAALQTHGPLTPHQLAPLAYCTLRHARRILLLLHLRGQVYISGYVRAAVNSRGPYTKIYALGIGVDALPPPPLTAEERMALSRGKKSVEEMDFERARRRQLRRKVKRDKLTAAFFGVKR